MILISDFNDFISYSPSIPPPGSSEKMCRSLSSHFEVHHKYSVARRMLNSLLVVWKYDETLSLVFDILLTV